MRRLSCSATSLHQRLLPMPWPEQSASVLTLVGRCRAAWVSRDRSTREPVLMSLLRSMGDAARVLPGRRRRPGTIGRGCQ